jgi:RNA polymerase sigma-70 factor (ECF subfamily)
MAEDQILGWVVAARDGDERAWLELFRGCFHSVWNATAGYGLQNTDREDVVQETFTRFVRSIHAYDPKLSRVQTYLAVIAKRICIDRVRRVKAFVPIDGEEGLQIPAPPEPDPQTVLSLRRSLENDLSPEQRLCVQLFHFEGLSYEEIANALGHNFHWVKNTLRAARTRLAKALESGTKV